MLPFLTPPVRFSFALSILLKFSDPEGCEAFNFRQKGHVNVDTVLRVDEGRDVQCISGTTL
jgi:hypothetical protein